MKRKIALLIASLFSILLLLNCKKDKTGSNPTPQHPIGLKIKVLEYGSEIPLANVKLTVMKCTNHGKLGCISYEKLRNYTSGVDGNINITVNEYPSPNDMLIAEESNHWTKSESEVFDTLMLMSNYDSAIVRLYPVASIKFHFKNVNTYGAKTMIRAYMWGLPDNKAPFIMKTEVFDDVQANNLDTIFTYKTYGNINNRLTYELIDSNYSIFKTVIDDTKFIPKSVNQPWNINF